MKKSKLEATLAAILGHHRHRRVTNEFLASYIIEVMVKHGMLPPYSEDKAKKARPVGHEWDDE